jgi:hypothetical protein
MRRALWVILAATSTAAASPVRLDVNGTCDLGLLPTKIRQLAPAVELDSNSATTISIVTRTTGDGVAATITRDGEREVRAASCDELVESVALILAMTITTAAEPPAIPIERPVTPERTDLTSEIPARSSLPSSPWSVLVGGAGSRTSEGWITRLIAGVRWRTRDRSMGAEVRVSSPMDESVNAAAQIRVWDATIALTPCLHASAFAACANLAGGFIRGTSTGLVDARSHTSPSMSLGARLEWTLPLTPRFGLRMHLDADAYLTATRFDVDQMTRWSHDRVEVRGGIGAVTHFP